MSEFARGGFTASPSTSPPFVSDVPKTTIFPVGPPYYYDSVTIPRAHYDALLKAQALLEAVKKLQADLGGDDLDTALTALFFEPNS